MELIAIRHGQTDHNVRRVIQGQGLDDPLNEAGRREVAALAELLRQDNFSAIYASHLKRAQETAAAIARSRQMVFSTRTELAERDYGRLTGRIWDEVLTEYGEYLQRDEEQLQFDYRQFGGEDHTQVRTRLRSVLADLTAAHSQMTVAVVTHGGIIRLLYDELKLDWPERVPNASLHRFQV